MKWTPEAEAAIKQAPFFVRRKVRARVQKDAIEAGRKIVTLAEVKRTQKRFITKMESEIKGYQVDTCFGPGGCPNRANSADEPLEKIEMLLKEEDLLSFLKQHVKEELKFHHEFRVAFADCPNACSQPQIKDVGIIGVRCPRLTGEVCTRCFACSDVCKEDAIKIEDKDFPEINFKRCLNCGQCIQVCPTGTIAAGEKGFKVLLGGKLGRHPKLARELPGIFSGEEVVKIVKACLDFYKKNSKNGRRFSEILTEADFKKLVSHFGK